MKHKLGHLWDPAVRPGHRLGRTATGRPSRPRRKTDGLDAWEHCRGVWEGVQDEAERSKIHSGSWDGGGVCVVRVCF